MYPGRVTTPRVIDVAEADFEREVIERSEEVPVLVDFWAPWCAPCRTLGPLLEKLVAECGDEVVLARMNVDDCPGAVRGCGVRSIPMLLGFRDRAVVAELVGAQPEPALRELLAGLLPGEAERLVRAAEEAAAAGKTSSAEQRYREALELEPRRARALVGLARLLSARGEREEPAALLERVVSDGALGREAERLAAELRTRADGSADEAELRRRLERAPHDLEARLALGRALAARGGYEEALEMLLTVVERDPAFADEAARKAMLDVFAVLGSGDPLVERFRRELAQVLFR